MKPTPQELNFIVIVIVAIIGIGIPIYVCCFAVLRTYCCGSISANEKTKCNKTIEARGNQIKVTKLFLSIVKLIGKWMLVRIYAVCVQGVSQY